MTEGAAARIPVRVRPGSSRDQLSWEGATLKASVKAPALEGKANQRLIQVLARALGLPRASVTIVHGHAGRSKLVEIAGLTQREAEDRLRLAAG